jgi:hypothetical protein
MSDAEDFAIDQARQEAYNDGWEDLAEKIRAIAYDRSLSPRSKVRRITDLVSIF